MTQVFLLFLCLCMTEVILGAQTQNEDSSDWSNNGEIIPIPSVDDKTPMLLDDIAIPDALTRNADPCTSEDCKWPKSGRYVTVPYQISSKFSTKQSKLIVDGLESFHSCTCIRFVPRKSSFHRDYIKFFSGEGCWSYIGRIKGEQNVSLQNDACLDRSTIQHEVLHALGFNHEQVRSDRDKYVWILYENITPKEKHNFYKKKTNNLGTPYDFTSVMEYSNFAFSKNGKQTIIAKCNPKLKFGHAKKMSVNDIIRINKLYKCDY